MTAPMTSLGHKITILIVPAVVVSLIAAGINADYSKHQKNAWLEPVAYGYGTAKDTIG